EGNSQTQEAIDVLREVIRLAPEDEEGYVRLTALCIKYQAHDLGQQIITAGLHYHPQSDRLILQRGVIHALSNQYDLAEQDFELTSQFAPEKNLSYAALGVNYMQAGNLPKALESLRQRVKEKPEDATLQYLLGTVLMQSGPAPRTPEFSEAQSALEK